MRVGAAQAWVPYCGAAPDPGELLARWNLDPVLLAIFALAVIFWTAATRRDPRALAAIALLAVLFVSPFCALTSALFSARAAHHAALVAVVAPLLAWALPDRAWRRPVPLAGTTALAAMTLWAWHIPRLYAAALSNSAIYWLMQFTLLGTALAFWLAVRRAEIPAAVAALLATMVQMGLLGALLTFTARPLYPPHLLGTWPWGLSPLEDQQLAGLIMWAPAAALYLIAALAIAGRWLRDAGRPVAR